MVSKTNPSGNLVSVKEQQENNFFYAPTASDEQEWDFSEQFRSSSHVFYCLSKPATESSCWVYASKLDGSEKRWLGIQLDVGSNAKGLLPSPDKKNILVIREQKAIIINADTLTQKEIAKAESETEFGTYTGFPSFVPAGRWVDNATVELSIFSAGSLEENSAPVEKKQIKIN